MRDSISLYDFNKFQLVELDKFEIYEADAILLR